MYSVGLLPVVADFVKRTFSHSGPLCCFLRVSFPNLFRSREVTHVIPVVFPNPFPHILKQ